MQERITKDILTLAGERKGKHLHPVAPEHPHKFLSHTHTVPASSCVNVSPPLRNVEIVDVKVKESRSKAFVIFITGYMYILCIFKGAREKRQSAILLFFILYSFIDFARLGHCGNSGMST